MRRLTALVVVPALFPPAFAAKSANQASPRAHPSGVGLRGEIALNSAGGSIVCLTEMRRWNEDWFVKE